MTSQFTNSGSTTDSGLSPRIIVGAIAVTFVTKKKKMNRFCVIIPFLYLLLVSDEMSSLDCCTWCCYN